MRERERERDSPINRLPERKWKKERERELAQSFEGREKLGKGYGKKAFHIKIQFV